MQVIQFNEVDAGGVIKWYCRDYISASEWDSFSFFLQSKLHFLFSNAISPWNSCQNKGRLWFFLELSSVDFVLVTVEEQFKKRKRWKRMIHSGLQKMLCWQKQLQPVTPRASTQKRPTHQTVPEVSADGFWFWSPQSRGKHQHLSAHWYHWARQPGEVHSWLWKKWQNLQFCFEL